MEDPLFRERVAAVEIELMALEITCCAWSREAARARPGPEASILKIKGTEIQQALTELMVEAVGPMRCAVRCPRSLDGEARTAIGRPR